MGHVGAVLEHLAVVLGTVDASEGAKEVAPKFAGALDSVFGPSWAAKTDPRWPQDDPMKPQDGPRDRQDGAQNDQKSIKKSSSKTVMF